MRVRRGQWSVICTELREDRGLGQFGKARHRKWYKRRASRMLRRIEKNNTKLLTNAS